MSRPVGRSVRTTSRSRRTTAGLAAGALAVSLPVLGNAGSAAAAPGDVTLRTTQDVTLVREGGTARVAVRVSVEGGAALAADVTVDYATVDGTATAGADYTGATGTLTFPAGTASGSTQHVVVEVAAGGGAEMAETLSIRLTDASAGATVAGGEAMVVVNANAMPYLDPGLTVRRRVRDLLARMTLADKVGQMTQGERANIYPDPGQITELRLGSVLSGGGSTPPDNTPTGWADMVDTFQRHALATPLQIPMIYGIDSVHGNGNLAGATIFPHNIGLGATREPRLVRKIQHAVARETRAIGIPWTFAPCVCVARDDRWGRTYESFSERPGLAGRMGVASTIGFQGRHASQLADRDRVLATAKHFAGDGSTEYGTGEGGGEYSIDQGVTVTSRERFERIDLAPYLPSLRQHVGTVMPSYSSVDFTEDGVGNPVKLHQHEQLLTGWLKEDHGFDGFIISDYEGIHHVAGNGHGVQVRRAVNAGLDMAMEPNDYAAFITDLTTQVEEGYVPMSRINDAVRRILTKKFQLGLFEKPFARRGLIDSIRSDEHLELARRAAAKSQVLLKNRRQALPLEQDATVYVAGRSADNIGNQAGGWTIQWQGVPGADAIEGTSILEGMQQVAPEADITFSEDASAPMAGHDVGVVVVGETPYSEGFGDVGGPTWPDGAPIQEEEEKSLRLQPGDRAVVEEVCSTLPTCVVLVVSGRPQIVTGQLPEIDALVASWLPGSEGGGVADVLFGERAFSGKLSFSWPRRTRQQPINLGDENYNPLFRYGFGLTTERTAD